MIGVMTPIVTFANVHIAGGLKMHLSNEAIRRMNDENYLPALEKFLRDRYEAAEKKIQEEIKEKPWKQKTYDRLQKRHEKFLNSLTTEQFMDFLSKCMQHQVKDVIEFNKEWDKQYKVIHGRFE